MSLYEELKQIEIISPVLSLLKSGKLKMDWDGKIRLEERVPFDRYWITNVFCPDRMCQIWTPIYFKRYGIIPKGCRNCWKVVLKPKTLRSLMEVNSIQKSLGIPSKCGLELRPYTGNVGGYGAYWYAPLDGGLEAGREMFVKLRKEFPSESLILKRGCTEMEMLVQPSSSWDKYADEWDFKEGLLNTTFVCESERPTKEPTAYVTYTLMQWIEWAFEHGDETYRDFTDHSFELVYELYQHEQNKVNKYKLEDFRSNYGPANNRSEYGTSQEESTDKTIGGPGSPLIQTIP